MPAIRYRGEQGGMATVSDKVIKKHLKAEVMNTPEFRDIELQIREEKLLRLHWSVMAQMPTGTGRRGSVLEYAYWHSPINGLC